MRQRFKRAAPFMGALTVSVLAHAATLSSSWITLPKSEPEPRSFSATLKPMQPAQSTALALARPASVKPRPAATAAPIVPTTAVPANTPASAPADIAASEETTGQTENPASVAAEETPKPEPVVVATAAPTTSATAAPTLPPAVRALPPRGRLSYNLNYYLGGSPLNVGTTEQSWEMTGNRYKIDSQSRTVGLARLTRFGPRIYTSSGEITEHGLQPREFTSSVTVSGNVDNSAARFDWGAQQLQFGRPTDQKSANLPPGAQDFISFMYQLSLAPITPLTGNRLSIPITNGVRFETTEFEVRAEEQMDTPLGTLRVLPIAQVRKPNTESMEVWLAAEYNYLPVRIRFIGRDGAVGGEQIVTAINVGQQ